MQPQPQSVRRWPAAHWQAEQGGWLAARGSHLLSAAIVASFALAAGVLIERRLEGAINRPLPAPGFWILGLGGATLSLVASLKLSARAAGGDRRSWGPRAMAARLGQRPWECVTALALVAATAALSIPGAPSSGWAPLWMVAALVAVWVAAPRRALAPGRIALDTIAGQDAPLAGSPRRPAELADHSQLPAQDAPGSVPSAPLPELPADPFVAAQITRYYAADSSDVVRGWLRVELMAGQRTASAHVAFCPPFWQMPQVEFRISEGAEQALRVRVGRLYPYGVRFDVKLAAAARAPLSAVLSFTATGRAVGREPLLRQRP